MMYITKKIRITTEGRLKNPENDRREFVGFLLYCGERPKGARRNIVGFLLYFGERLQGARRNIVESE